MKSQDDGGKGPGGSDRGVTPRYITKKSLVTSAWRPPKQPDNISCFQQDRVFCLYGIDCGRSRSSRLAGTALEKRLLRGIVAAGVCCWDSTRPLQAVQAARRSYR